MRSTGAANSAVIVMVRVSRSWVMSVTGTGLLLIVIWIVGDELVDARDAAAPELLEHRGDRAHRPDLTMGELLAAVAPLAEQPGPLEHGDVLLHGRERH